MKFLFRFYWYIWKKIIALGIKYNYRILFKGRNWYKKWIELHEKYTVDEIQSEINDFKLKPLISIIMPVYKVKLEYLEEAIISVMNQYYNNWELCIVDDFSEDINIKNILEYYSKLDCRIKVKYNEQNKGISMTSNEALKMANGEFVTFLDNDDVLPRHALYEVVKAINENPQAKMLFSNEDKLKNNKRMHPFFKKGWSRRRLEAVNYICHLVVYKTELVKEIGGFRTGYDGVQDWDLALRITNITDNIVHIPLILYHWRIIPGSTSMSERNKKFVKKAQKKVINDLLLLKFGGRK